MQFHRFLLPLLLLASTATPASAAGTVQLELVGDLRGSAMLFQDWAQLLAKAGIENVRVRAIEDADKVGIETQGTGESPIYVVTGVVRSRDELVLPGGRFRRSEVGRLKEWLANLAERGPAAKQAGRSPFGLTSAQFDRIRADLATPVDFSTQTITPPQFVEKLAGRLKAPLKLDSETARALGDQPLGEELIGLSGGTALAYVLRSAGYGLLPRTVGDQFSYDVVNVQGKAEVWPVGSPVEKSAHEALPALFEFLNVNVQNVPAARALAAIGKRLKTPMLLDHAALARHGVDPAKAMVTLPRSRTTYSLALRKLLFQAGMKFELRQDEAGTTLLWITSLKPG